MHWPLFLMPDEDAIPDRLFWACGYPNNHHNQ